jgi:hypothetical protein
MVKSDEKWRSSAAAVLATAGLDERAKTSVELLLASFCFGDFTRSG